MCTPPHKGDGVVQGGLAVSRSRLQNRHHLQEGLIKTGVRTYAMHSSYLGVFRVSNNAERVLLFVCQL